VSPSGGGTVFVNPSTFANGPISRGGVDETETTSFVHELGHEVGSLFPERALAISRNVGRNFQVRGAEGFPVEFENRYRSEVGLDRREFYGVNHDYAGNSYLQLFPTGFPND
jgi:hypothetical protein